jgi:hypothetical protein
MGRKLTDEELADPDFQALIVALEKASKPVTVKRPNTGRPVSEVEVHDEPASAAGSSTEH